MEPLCVTEMLPLPCILADDIYHAKAPAGPAGVPINMHFVPLASTIPIELSGDKSSLLFKEIIAPSVALIPFTNF